MAVGRAIVREPEVFLFDEPLSNLDAKLREELRFEIKSLVRRMEITAVYVTHDQAEAMVISDRIAVHPNVAAVRHAGYALSLSNRAMVGQQRIPDRLGHIEAADEPREDLPVDGGQHVGHRALRTAAVLRPHAAGHAAPRAAGRPRPAGGGSTAAAPAPAMYTLCA